MQRGPADATRIAVLLEAHEKEVTMIVADNGRGISPSEPVPSASPSERLLLGIRERLPLISGTSEVDSAPGQCLTLSFWMPL